MKTTITPLCIALSLTLGISAPALADHRYRDDYRGDYRGGYYESAPRHHHGGHYRGGNGWVGPAAVLAITGIVAGVAASTYYAPRPVYVAPPEPVYVPAPRPVYVVPARPVYALPPQPVYGPPPGFYSGY